ncbi:enoyl-CoA hydratase [Gordonia sp. SID5947]|uniref:MaoC family dehydratase n=1 Tax=Gordonia sp. SID5947 TaxID=2690315 RepID=UPI00136843C5|nr:MaoC family dehydratase [Gordonia sp. SID5947]MYR07953.1 enoyl-CoA hydratase [Gordonia sp. SID5947]
MPLNPASVGQKTRPVEVSWTSKDTLLYAVGVGAGLGAPAHELAYTTENSNDLTQRALPTFAVVLNDDGPQVDIGTYDESQLVHAEQGLVLHTSLPPAGTVRVATTVTGIHDKGSGGLVAYQTDAVDPADGSPVFTTHSTMFIRGEGGFGGERGPVDEWTRPSTPPDAVVTYATRPEQALLYRLSGDRNPLHSDPHFAARAGFDRPILHGLCTYGVAGRALLEHVADNDVARFGAMRSRFTAPVYPGDSLSVALWRTAEGASFQVFRDGGELVIDRGRFTLRS